MSPLHGTGLPHFLSTRPESSEPCLQKMGLRVKKTKSLGDLRCLMVIDKTFHTGHGGISSET
jgi:hypothetical protein